MFTETKTETETSCVDGSGASAGITNDGRITVSIGDSESMLQTTLDINVAETFVKVLLISIDCAKNLKVPPSP